MADYYELLQIPRDANASAIRAAYARVARERHPDRFTDPEEKRRAEEALTQATAAFNTLSNENRRREYDQSLSTPKVAVPERIAQDAYERGMQLMERRAFHEAVELLRAAVYHQPREARYHAALAGALARNPHWVREAVSELEQAIQIEPQRAQFHTMLAEVLLGQGLKLRARREAETALRLNPSDRAARAVLDATAQ
jgi:curved DNA-binding protein CbpA